MIDMHPSLAAVIDALEGDPATKLATVKRLSDDAAAFVARRTTTTRHGAHANFTAKVTLYAARETPEEWGGSFSIIADELIRTALEGDDADQPDGGMRVEVVWLDALTGDARCHTTGLLVDADDDALVMADGVRIERDNVIGFALA